jgi:hypothetical protein
MHPADLICVMRVPMIGRGHNGMVRIIVANDWCERLEKCHPKRLRSVCWHLPQPVNAAEPHQKAAHILLSSGRTCATRHSSYKTPLFDEIAVATVAQCMSSRLDGPEALKYPSSPQRPLRQTEVNNAAGCAHGAATADFVHLRSSNWQAAAPASVVGWCAPDAVPSYAARPIVTFPGVLFTGRRGAE